ncbi:two-component system response regulator [Melittangium boletus DSM 14713]|uniref:Two-component system response regulator n=1 Tax=Melittangium boletus DSM 14713 TaxID=1294270 RepID=A0A250INM7_9BACT|nr:two-component system response regulator [Melittangium boletus DSM 14713]
MSRVLVIDDSPMLVELTVRALSAAGYHATGATDLASLEVKLSEGPFSLILMDVNMPEMFGDDVVEYLRTQKKVTSKLVLYSDISEEELAAKTRQSGADAYILKGGGLEAVIGGIMRILGAPPMATASARPPSTAPAARPGAPTAPRPVAGAPTARAPAPAPAARPPGAAQPGVAPAAAPRPVATALAQPAGAAPRPSLTGQPAVTRPATPPAGAPPRAPVGAPVAPPAARPAPAAPSPASPPPAATAPRAPLPGQAAPPRSATPVHAPAVGAPAPSPARPAPTSPRAAAPAAPAGGVPAPTRPAAAPAATVPPRATLTPTAQVPTVARPPQGAPSPQAPAPAPTVVAAPPPAAPPEPAPTPAAAPAPAATGGFPSAAKMAAAAGRKPRILIVDDSEMTARIIEADLVSKGFEVHIADSADKATKIILKKQTRPDLVLLDVRMPNVNGEQFCRFIKSNSLFKGIKVLLCSGENVEELQRICREAGADGYVPKDAVLGNLVAKELNPVAPGAE